MKRSAGRSVRLVVVLATVAGMGAVQAADIRVGVASNFSSTLAALAERFERQSGHRVVLSSGSTGKLYAQIKNGAPFDLFFAADAARPQRLEQEGEGVTGTRFTYAVGRIVLWSPIPDRIDATGAVLKTGDFRKLAIANPVTAPYGLAAQQAMMRLGVWEAMQPRLVRGENISQTFQFVASGNADLGFVALSQLRTGKGVGGSYWEVPPEYYQPIEQQVILLRVAREPEAARELLVYLRGGDAQAMLESFGYGISVR